VQLHVSSPFAAFEGGLVLRKPVLFSS
jgi:hypothetical protein